MKTHMRLPVSRSAVLRPTRMAAPVILCLIAAVGLPSTATAAPATSSVGARSERVLLALTPHDRGALRALAHSSMARGSSHAAALAAALPSDSQRNAVIATVRTLGLTVDRVSRLSVLVSADRKSVV